MIEPLVSQLGKTATSLFTCYEAFPQKPPLTNYSPPCKAVHVPSGIDSLTIWRRRRTLGSYETRSTQEAGNLRREGHPARERPFRARSEPRAARNKHRCVD